MPAGYATRPYLLSVVLVACATVNRASPAPKPVVPTGVWQLRLDVDSAPRQRKPNDAAFGTIDFTAGVSKMDFRRSINRQLPAGAYVSLVPDGDAAYRIVLGDSSSIDERIIMMGRLAAPDSIVGTWTETVICCSATGRFTLWRAKAPR